MSFIRGPWACVHCKRVYESLDEPAAGVGIPGEEAKYVCVDCNQIILREFTDYGL